MANFKINDRHIAFCNAIAGGMKDFQAYIEFMSPGKKAKKGTAAAHASRLLKRPQIQQLIEQARKARAEAITGEAARIVAKEFSTTLLTVDELDAYHSAVVQGLVEVEEVVPVYTNTYDKAGRIVSRQTSFMRVKRPPNIRERQISIAELYKRQGSYAPSKLFGAFAKAKEEDGEQEIVERFVLLSTGEKIPLLP